MHTAIALTLLFAGITAALGARANYLGFRKGRARETVGFVVAALMAAWFLFAAYWVFAHEVVS